MDTRLRKFDRSMIPKTIAFLLALIFVFAGTTRVMNLIHSAETKKISDSYYSNVLIQGKNFNMETSTMFTEEYSSFMRYVVQKATLYGDGTKEDYNELKERVEKSLRAEYDSYKDELISEIENDCSRNYYRPAINYLQSGFVSLKRLDSHKGNHKISGIFVYEEDEDYYTFNGDWVLNEDGQAVYINDEDYEDYDGDFDIWATTYYDVDGDLVTAPPSAASTSVVSHFEMKNGIPAEILKKAGDADAVVIICNTNYNDEGMDGYYAVNVVDDVLYDNFMSGIKSGEYSSNYYAALVDKYDEFRDEAKRMDEGISLYENLKFAFVNKDTGKIISNVKNVDSSTSAKELENIFLKYPWSFIKTGSDGYVGMGSRYQKLYEESDYSNSVYRSGIGRYYDESYLKELVSNYALYVSFDETLAGDDAFSKMEETYTGVYKEVRSAFSYTLAMLIGFIICVIVLIIKSGRKHGDDELHMMYTDKIFTLLRTAINGGIIVGLGGICLVVIDSWNANELAWIYTVRLFSILAMMIAAVLIDWILYIARHIKNGTLMKNIMLAVFIRWLAKLGKKAKQKHIERREKRKARPAVYKDIFNDVLRKLVLWVIVPNSVVSVIAICSMAAESWIFGIFFCVLLAAYDIFVVIGMLRYAYSLRKVFYALNQVKMGNYGVTIDTTSMPQTVRAYANDVTAINQGLSYAVENAVKEQRMKTELITNVSHDLKTPLTSIITYVDLLSRCNINDASAQEYIDVLGEKSARLKRLIEDLVEASKASSGAVNVELIKVSLNELTRQITGEYDDEFENRGLTLVEQEDDEEIIIMADSKLCYRVFDNLMSNVKKYAMPGTRVYLRIYKKNGKGIISLRNVSENQLNIPASELLARFVRGDKSRSSDGNGLGLSIAENFCKLQGGKLSLEINGDLFTATVEYQLSE
ncbi:MAG: HAMP domain-containing histidine kinase [Ruminococcus sp.]|nr:HAMP domain-containing histidine kinase [Ruminococcus sp.]